jgi:hypothetical protein
MQVKITGKTPQLFNHYLAAVLNTACVVVMGGHIPSQREIDEPEIFKRYWFRDKDGANRFNLYPLSNDYYANVRDEGENFIVLQFSYRHDTEGDALCNALANLLAARFRENVEIITE